MLILTAFHKSTFPLPTPGKAEDWTFGENACHPEPIRFAQGKLRVGSGSPDAELLRCAQDDSQDTAHVLSREVFSPNVWRKIVILDFYADFGYSTTNRSEFFVMKWWVGS
jgi:hypothetical protein